MAFRLADSLDGDDVGTQEETQHEDELQQEQQEECSDAASRLDDLNKNDTVNRESHRDAKESQKFFLPPTRDVVSSFRPTEDHPQQCQFHVSPRRHKRCSSMDAERWSETDQDGSCVDQHTLRVARRPEQALLMGSIRGGNHLISSDMIRSNSADGNSRREDARSNELSSSASVNQALHPHTNKTIHVVTHTAVVGGPTTGLSGGRTASPSRSATVDFVSELTSLNDDEHCGGSSEQDPYEAFRQRHNNRHHQRHQHTGRYNRAGAYYYGPPPPVPELGERCLSGSVGAARGSEIASSIGRACHIQTHLLINDQQDHDDHRPADTLRPAPPSQQEQRKTSNDETMSVSDTNDQKERSNCTASGRGRDRHSDTFLYNSNSATADAEFAYAVEAAALAELSMSAGELFDSTEPQYVGEATSEAGVDVSGPSAAAEAAAFDTPQLYAPPPNGNGYHQSIDAAPIAGSNRASSEIEDTSAFPMTASLQTNIERVAMPSETVVNAGDNTAVVSASSSESDADVSAIIPALELAPTVNKPRSRSQRHLYQQWKRQQQALRPPIPSSSKGCNDPSRSENVPNSQPVTHSRSRQLERSVSAVSSSLDTGDSIDAEERMEGHLNAVIPDNSILHPRSQSNRDDLQMLTHLIDEMDAIEENHELQVSAVKVDVSDEKKPNLPEQAEVCLKEAAKSSDTKEARKSSDNLCVEGNEVAASSDEKRIEKRRSRLFLVQKSAAAAVAEVSKISFTDAASNTPKKDFAEVSELSFDGAGRNTPKRDEEHPVSSELSICEGPSAKFNCSENESLSLHLSEEKCGVSSQTRRPPGKRRPLTYRKGDIQKMTEERCMAQLSGNLSSKSIDVLDTAPTRDASHLSVQEMVVAKRRPNQTHMGTSSRGTEFSAGTTSLDFDAPFADNRRPCDTLASSLPKISTPSYQLNPAKPGLQGSRDEDVGGFSGERETPDKNSPLNRMGPQNHQMICRYSDKEEQRREVPTNICVPSHDDHATFCQKNDSTEGEVNCFGREDIVRAKRARGEDYSLVNKPSLIDEATHLNRDKMEELIPKSRKQHSEGSRDDDDSSDRAIISKKSTEGGTRKHYQSRLNTDEVARYHIVPNCDEEEGRHTISDKTEKASEPCHACGFEWGPWEKTAFVMFLLSFSSAVISLLLFEIILITTND